MKKTIVLILSLIFIIAWGIRFYTLNGTFSAHNEYQTINYELGDPVQFNDNMSYNAYHASGYSITANHVRIISFEQFLSEFNKTTNDFTTMPEKFLIVETTIENIFSDNTEEGIYFYSLPIIGTNWYTFFNGEATAYANNFFNNNTSASYGVLVHRGDSAIVNIVYNLYENTFSKKQWDYLDYEPMWMSITIQPENQRIKLK